MRQSAIQPNGLAVIFEGFVVLPKLVPNGPAVVVCLRQFGIEMDCFGMIDKGFVEFFERFPDATPVGMRGRKVRPKPNGFRIVGERFVMLLLPCPSSLPRIERVGQVGVQADRFVAIGQS